MHEHIVIVNQSVMVLASLQTFVADLLLQMLQNLPVLMLFNWPEGIKFLVNNAVMFLPFLWREDLNAHSL